MNDGSRGLFALYGAFILVIATTVAVVPGVAGAAPGATELGNVAIDVKPDSETNTINVRKRGVTPVAILHTDAFDPATVDVSSVRFGAPDVVQSGGGATAVHGGHFEDVDGDGDLDLVLHFRTRAAGFDMDDEEALLVGNTTNGESFAANDSIRTVGNGGGPP